MYSNPKKIIKSSKQEKSELKNIELSNSQVPNKSNNDSKIQFQGLALNEDKILNNRIISENKNHKNNNAQNFNIKKEISKSSYVSNKSEKENKLHKFFVNDNDENKIYRHKDNTINTTKYNFITFLPKALLFQFMRLANIYFLIIAIIQCIPVLSPLTPSTAIAPIAFVLTVSLIREAIEDYSRYKFDKLMNKEKALVFRNDSWKEIKSGDLKIGDLVLVQEEKDFPSDLILLDSNLKDGLCYIETATLDGEKTLKLKKSEKSTSGYFNNGGKWKDKFNLKGTCTIDPPSLELYKLDGKLEICLGDSASPTLKFKLPLDSKQLLLKGAVLKNTKWIIGIVCYTGHLTKLMLNSKKPRIKFSRVETLMSNLLVAILIMQIIICLACALLNSVFYYNYLKGNLFLDYLDQNIVVDSVYKYFTYLLLLNTMIPISLIITLEIVKLIQGFFMSFDVEMYSNVRKKFVKAKSVSLNEELGKVDYIFSDKTGTLTCNKMNFKFSVIGDVCYEFIKQVPNSSNLKEFYNLNRDSDDTAFRNENDIQLMGPNQLLNIKKSSAKIHKTSYGNLQIESGSNQNVFYNLDTDYKLLEEFLKVLALNNDCVIIDKEKEQEFDYSGLSPDDIELTKAAKSLGCELRKSFNTNEKILNVAGVEKRFQILNTIEFNSDRKKSSIIVKEDDQIKLYIKGADSMMYPILSKENKPEFIEQASRYVDLFSKKGYRTLLVGMKVLGEKEYHDWNEILKAANLNLMNKAQKLQEAHELIESNIHLLGATIVEDKLQDEVPETIRDLRLGDIKIWMLTGDKIDTAENIAKSCNLISEELIKFKIPSDFFPSFEYFVKIFNDYLDKEHIDLDNFADAEKRIMKYSIIVDFLYLFETFKDLSKKWAFVRIAKYAQSVICSRCSPNQKAEVVKMMKEFDKNLVTLSIGDGGNDVSMIMEAHIGVGVYGEEGMMAVQSCDYAIGEFKMLRRLLLYHGRTNYVRICEMILYFFYKNFVFTITHFYYAFLNNFSGQTIIDDWFISLYNMIFTSIPLISKAIIDHDIKPEDGLIIEELLPFIYKETKQKPIFKVSSFILELMRGMIQGFLNFFILYFIIGKNPIDSDGNIADIWYFSVSCYTNIIFIVSFNLIISSKYITIINIGTMFMLSWVLYFFFVYLVHNISVFNSYATMTVAFRSASIYLSLILIVGITIIIDLGIYTYKHLFKGSLVSIIMNEKSKEGFLELGSVEDSLNECNYRLPSIIEDLLIKKQNLTNKENNLSKNNNKANERDLKKIDRVDYNHPSDDKLILCNNIQISENRYVNENFSADIRQGVDKTESNCNYQLQKINIVPSDKFLGKNIIIDKNFKYDKVQNSINDKSISVSNNNLNEIDLDNSQNVIKVEKINDKNFNYFSSRGLEKSIQSYQFNIHNIENKDRLSDRRKTNKNNI